MVDREVAERVRCRFSRRERGREHHAGDRQRARDPHRSASKARLGARSVQRGETRVRFEGPRQIAARKVRPPGVACRDAGVVQERRVPRPESHGSLRVRQALDRVAGPGQGPPERIGRAHAGRVGPCPPREPHRAVSAAMVGLDDRHLGIDVHPAATQQALLHLHERKVLACVCAATGRQLRFGERHRVFRQRQTLDHPLVAADRGGQVTARSGRAREPRLRGGVFGIAGERQAVRVPRRADPASCKLEVAEQRLHVCEVLPRVAAGGGREPHRIDGPRQVPVQLTDVRDTGIGIQIRLQVDHALQCPLSRLVAAQLDERVHDHAVRLDDAGRRGPRPLAEAQAGREVVAGVRKRAHRRQRPRVASVAVERLAQRRLGAGVVAGVERLARLLEIGVAQRRVRAGSRGVRLDRALQRGDPRVGRSRVSGASPHGSRAGPGAGVAGGSVDHPHGREGGGEYQQWDEELDQAGSCESHVSRGCGVVEKSVLECR